MTTARTLDIIVTHASPSRVYYGFPVGELRIEHAVMYPEGKFDTSTLEVGKRYIVKTKVMSCMVLNRKAQQYVPMDRYVWVTATEVVDPVAKIAARSTKQRQRSEAFAAKPLADNGALFSW